MRSLSWFLLFTATNAYRVTEYSEERCTHKGLSFHHLADTKSCHGLDVPVTSSILVKIDNFHDDQYQLNVYENDDCTGDIVGAISDLNGCMDLYSPDNNRMGRSVALTAIPDPGKERHSASENFEAGRTFNGNYLTGGGDLIAIPIARDNFRLVRASDRLDDGTYDNDAIETFYAGSLGELLSREDTDRLTALKSQAWDEWLLNQNDSFFNERLFFQSGL
ncbi:hypothetical protein PHISCL_00862 [Aspergillus sclerotialis]|uniref:Uncharacterized protein n=1 Tax=Aspergillus sclerotialis TaxID=2070753 RepID=A0A3A2ZZN5_9EURO|nr:hypothetical protein PHISCL_00862 [Aspergillus sclerotialis]